MKKHWYAYLWVASLLYLLLGFFNILFAWLGRLCFFIPLIISVVSGTKSYCNRYCGRGQLRRSTARQGSGSTRRRSGKRQ